MMKWRGGEGREEEREEVGNSRGWTVEVEEIEEAGDWLGCLASNNNKATRYWR